MEKVVLGTVPDIEKPNCIEEEGDDLTLEDEMRLEDTFSDSVGALNIRMVILKTKSLKYNLYLGIPYDL